MRNFFNVFPRFCTDKVLQAHRVVAYHSITVTFIDINYFTTAERFLFVSLSTAIVCENIDNLLIAQTFFSALARDFLVNVSGIRHSSTSISVIAHKNTNRSY